MDCGLRPELASIADKIATWADQYDPPPHEREDRLRYPYLGTDYAFQSKGPKDIHWASLDEFRHERRQRDVRCPRSPPV